MAGGEREVTRNQTRHSKDAQGAEGEKESVGTTPSARLIKVELNGIEPSTS